jgi:hypothetical protein
MAIFSRQREIRAEIQMSTKSSLYYEHHKEDEGHKLNIHIYEEMHQPVGTVIVELSCAVCNCSYKFLMDRHLGEQLAERLKLC